MDSRVQPLVTAAPIPNVGELQIRVQEKRAADAAAAQAERLKVYRRQRPLGQHSRSVGNEQPVEDQAPSEPLSNPNQSPQSPQPSQPLAPSDQPSACAIEEPGAADDQPNSPGQFPREPSSRPSAPDAPLSLPALEEKPGAPDQPGIPVDQPSIGGGARDGRPAADQPDPALVEPVAAAPDQPSTSDERLAADKPDPPDQPDQSEVRILREYLLRESTHLDSTMESPIRSTFCRASGVSFEGRQAAVRMLRPGQPLALVRDSDNEHDPHAIAIYTADEQRLSLGYIGRDINRSQAFESLLAGQTLPAVVHSVGQGYSGFWGFTLRV
jgi:hypothetical protein